MSEWIVKDGTYWHTQTRQHFPFIFTISKSKHGYGNQATIEIYRNHTESGPSGDAVMQAVKEYFDSYIAKEESKEKRFLALEEKIKKLEEIAAEAALDYQI